MIFLNARTSRFALIVAGFLLVVYAATRAQTQPTPSPGEPPAPSGIAADGKKIYKSYGCYGCHGFGGQGGVTGTRLSGNPISFAAFTRALRQPRDQMPPYTSKVVSDKEVADLFAFVSSFPKPVDVNTIPLLKEPKNP